MAAINIYYYETLDTFKILQVLEMCICIFFYHILLQILNCSSKNSKKKSLFIFAYFNLKHIIVTCCLLMMANLFQILNKFVTLFLKKFK
jgi:hypothetical protein